MKRRSLALWFGAASAGLLGGASTAFWHSASDDDAGPTSTSSANLWSMSFERLDGTPLAMASLRGHPLLVNFWATWCAPCVVELPLLDRFYDGHRADGWQVLALAVDTPDAVRAFLVERRLRMPVALAGDAGLMLSRTLGNSAAALPFTALFAADGTLRKRHLGVLNDKLLAGWKNAIELKNK